MALLKKAAQLGATVLFLGVFWSIQTIEAKTIVDSNINENTAWVMSASPYVLERSISVAPHTTLSIEPGVVVKFDYGASLYINGTLNALGTEVNPIYFTSNYDDEAGGSTDDEEFCYEDIDDQGNIIGEICESYDLGDPFSGDWDGIYFSNSINSNLENVFFYYSQNALTLNSSRVYIKHATINNSTSGITALNSSHVEVLDGVLNNLENEALVLFNGSSFIGDDLKLDLSSTSNDGIVVFNNSEVSIKNSSFKNCPTSACITVFDGNDYVINPSSINIASTVFEGGLGSGLLSFGSSNMSVTIKNSSFSNFYYFAVENYTNFTLHAEDNFWGDASGPFNASLNPTGLGEFVYGNVDFTPWLQAYPPVAACCSNVLFLPGLEASRLYKQKTILGIPVEDQLWESNTLSDVEDLYLNTDGTSKNSNIYTRDIIKETNTPIPAGFLGQNIYKSFADTMDNLVTDEKINGWKEYAYDWRQDINDIVNNGTKYQNGSLSLVDTLQFLVDTSKNDKVTIVAHSNGGLLAKAFLKKLQDDKSAGVNTLIDHVDVLVLVAVPEIGTAKAVPAILHGYDQRILGGLLLNEVHGRELGRNMLGAYGLLPSKEYINRVSASPVTFVDTAIPSNVTTNMVQTFGSAVSSYGEYKDFIFGAESRTNPPINQINLPISLSPSLFAQAETLHNTIDAWLPPANLRVIEIAGWGLETIASFEYYPKCQSSVLPGCNFMLDQRPNFTFDGDGTVIVPSAQYMNFLGAAEKYWVDLNKYNVLQFPRVKHPNILETTSVLEFISDKIKNLNQASYNYLSTTAPIDTSNRLRLSIHSPVTLDAYDAEGNHTGKICPPNSDFCYAEENISNSSYLEFGEGKYINLPEEQFSKIKLQGTSTGTFTYESEKVSPSGASTVTTFKDIPVTPATKAEITKDAISHNLKLTLDQNGDGTTGITLQAPPGSIISLPTYVFSGFLQPINDTARQAGQALSVFKAGSTVPVKFQLKNAYGVVIPANALPLWLTPQKGTKMTAPIDESVYTTTATNGNTFRWDSSSQQYIYNWSTKGLVAGYWYKISVKLDDGNTYSVTIGLR